MIGIDIGSKFIKVCRIANISKNDVSVFASMQDVTNLDDSQKTKVLSSLMEKLDVKQDSSFLAVGGKDIFCRDVIVPNIKLNSKNLKEDIIANVSNAVTEDFSSMYSAHSVTRSVSEKESCIMFSAVPKQIVNSKFNLINSLKNYPAVGVTMESFALANAFVKFGPSYKDTESVILINIGNNTSNIVVLNNKELVFVKDIEFGGKNITKDIAGLYMIPERLAEELKRRQDLRDQINFDMKSVLKKSTPSIIETIFRTIEYCVTRQFIIAVDRIVITGGGSLTDGIAGFIEEILGIPTTNWNPLQDCNVVGYANKDFGAFIAIALGLALEKEQK